jgi:integrase
MARITLTQLKVDRMRPDPAKRVEVSDHRLPQLRLVVQPSGARSWAVRTRINGKTAKLTIGDARVLDLAKARTAAREKLAEIAEGRDPRSEKHRRDATTLGGVAELYLKDVAGETRRRTQVERERHLRRDWKPLHDRPISEIRRADVAARLLEIKDTHGPIAANRSRTTLHGLFGWAVDQDLVEANVVASTRRPLRREPTRARVLTPHERAQVWAATAGAGAFSAIVRLLLLTAQRKGEVAGMLWSEVDFERAVWALPPERTKNGVSHLVPLSRQAVDLIRAQQRRDGRDLVFGDGGGPFSGWSRSKGRLDARCGLAGWTLHDLRRTASTAMNDELGIAPHVVEAAINHVSGAAKRGVAGTYNRALYLKERTRALQAWADHLTGEPETGVVEFKSA